MLFCDQFKTWLIGTKNLTFAWSACSIHRVAGRSRLSSAFIYSLPVSNITSIRQPEVGTVCSTAWIANIAIFYGNGSDITIFQKWQIGTSTGDVSCKSEYRYRIGGYFPLNIGVLAYRQKSHIGRSLVLISGFLSDQSLCYSQHYVTTWPLPVTSKFHHQLQISLRNISVNLELLWLLSAFELLEACTEQTDNVTNAGHIKPERLLLTNNFYCKQLHFQTARWQVHLALQSPATQQPAYTVASHHQHSNSQVQHLSQQLHRYTK